MVRPLGLPVGSVRALLLLALTVRAVFDLRTYFATPAADRVPPPLAPWLLVAVVIAAASYFAARSAASEGGQRPRKAPLGLPRGTVRLIFLILAGYGTFVYFHYSGAEFGGAQAFWILAAYGVGILVHWIVSARRGADEGGALFFEHLLALVSLLSAGGLVWLAADPSAAPPGWVEPLLGAIVVHYFAAR